jgi:hypothetical protein
MPSHGQLLSGLPLQLLLIAVAVLLIAGERPEDDEKDSGGSLPFADPSSHNGVRSYISLIEENLEQKRGVLLSEPKQYDSKAVVRQTQEVRGKSNKRWKWLKVSSIFGGSKRSPESSTDEKTKDQKATKTSATGDEVEEKRKLVQEATNDIEDAMEAMGSRAQHVGDVAKTAEEHMAAYSRRMAQKAKLFAQLGYKGRGLAHAALEKAEQNEATRLDAISSMQRKLEADGDVSIPQDATVQRDAEIRSETSPAPNKESILKRLTSMFSWKN